MERDDIIKALECCITDSCISCPYADVGVYSLCGPTLLEDALSLIKELTEENERLLARNFDLAEKGEKVVIAYKKLSEENESRKQTIDQLGKNNDEIARVYPLAIKEAKADTVREYREKIYRALAHYDHKDMFNKKVFLDALDQIAKEMLEGNDDND